MKNRGIAWPGVPKAHQGKAAAISSGEQCHVHCLPRHLLEATDKNSFLDMLALRNEGAFRKFAERIL